jgi:PAS domain S-box-containing protein
MKNLRSFTTALKQLPDFSPDILCSIDEQGRFLFVPPAAKPAWGYAPEELAGKPYMGLVLPEDRADTEKAAKAVMQGANVQDFENRCLRKDGTVMPMTWSARWSEEEKTIYCIARDATQRKEADRKNALQERRLQRAYKLARLAWWEYDIATQMYTSSDELFQMYGIPVSEGNQTPLAEFLSRVHPDDVERLTRDLHMLCENTYFDYEHRVVKPCGEVIHVIHYSELVRNEQGVPIALHGTTKDVTEERQKEAALQESNHRYALVNQATSDAVWDWDIEKDCIQWGEGFHTIFGYDIPELTLNRFAVVDYIHPDDKEKVTSKIDKILRSSDTRWQDEFRLRRANGTYADVVDRGFILRDANGKAMRMVGAVQDISRQKRAEQDLKLSEEKYRLLFYNSPRPKWIFEASTLRVVDVNDAAMTLYGYSKEEFLSLKITELNTHERESEVRAIVSAFLNNECTSFDKEVNHKNKYGNILLVRVVAFPIQLPTGLHVMATCIDLTERVQLQQKLLAHKVAAQKQVTKAMLEAQEKERSQIGGELHDNVCQLLTTAKLYIENARHMPDQQEVFTKKGVDLLLQSLNEIRYLSRQLASPAMRYVSFEATLKDLINHYLSLHLFEIHLSYEVREETIESDLKLTIYRILQEQFNNTVKYAKASKVTVTLRSSEEILTVSYTDNGIGYDCASLKTGLGLKNTRSRAEAFRGDVHITSAVGKGCRVQLTFPIGEAVESYLLQ